MWVISWKWIESQKQPGCPHSLSILSLVKLFIKRFSIYIQRLVLDSFTYHSFRTCFAWECDAKFNPSECLFLMILFTRPSIHFLYLSNSFEVAKNVLNKNVWLPKMNHFQKNYIYVSYLCSQIRSAGLVKSSHEHHYKIWEKFDAFLRRGLIPIF